MNYLNDLRYINTQLPAQRVEEVKSSVYWNDYDSALEVLRHSRHATRSEVFRLARAAMLMDIGAMGAAKELE